MFDFLKYTKIYFLISAIVIGIGLFSIVTWGFKYAVDFTGGTSLEYQFNPKVSQDLIKKVINENKIELLELREQPNSYIIRTKTIDEKQEQKLQNDITQQLKTKITVLRVETVGPVVGKETIQKTLIASGLAVIGILLYVAYAFRNFNYAFAAISALVHDILVVVGSYSLLSYFFNAEVDTLFVTALLTTMSFSVHDTIVVFDQMRDYQKKFGKSDVEMYANRSLTETMVRSVNNSMTIVFMLLALVLLGGTTIKFFSATLLIGTLTGTYSSPFIATPIAVWLEKRSLKK